ncbi:MAG: hypothetical protein DMF61_05875 [Blastocatellia bacterium AA13]|nr:MAG: hypothetical protein DMF61_05875 [Blastocatellia bacterium AA13]
MTKEARPLVLVVEDVEETRDCLEGLLEIDGYRVEPVRNERDAIFAASREAPSLILVSLAGSAAEVIAAAIRIRTGANLTSEIPVVVFCIDTVDEGDEIEIAKNVFATRPDNFNQLRALLRRLLSAGC